MIYDTSGMRTSGKLDCIPHLIDFGLRINIRRLSIANANSWDWWQVTTLEIRKTRYLALFTIELNCHLPDVPGTPSAPGRFYCTMYWNSERTTCWTDMQYIHEWKQIFGLHVWLSAHFSSPVIANPVFSVPKWRWLKDFEEALPGTYWSTWYHILIA